MTLKLGSADEPVGPSEERVLTRRRRDTRGRLTRAAGVVLAERGTEAATVEGICEQAGFSRGAFYSNFASKDELLLELAHEISTAKIEAIEVRLEELTSSGVAKLTTEAVVAGLLDVLSEDRVGVLLMSEARTTAMRIPEIATAYVMRADRTRVAVAAIIADVLREAHLRGRLPAAEIARHLIRTWEDSSFEAALERLDPGATRRRVTDRVTAIARALMEA